MLQVELSLVAVANHVYSEDDDTYLLNLRRA